jgi:hypothetical protein
MTTSTAHSAGVPARIASASHDAPKTAHRQTFGAANVNPDTTPDPNPWLRRALLASGIVLGGVSVSLAALAGWARGATQFEAVAWGAAGAALALVSLLGLSIALASHGSSRRAGFVAWGLALAFTITAALGSQHAGREHASRLDSAGTGDRARLEADWKRATDALAMLPQARPSGVISQQLAALLKDSRLADCKGWLASKSLRTVCVEKVEPRRTELATAEARDAAQKAASDASAALAKLSVTKPANTDAAAVARYLAAVGITVAVDRLADILNLLTVLAVEVTGAVAIALGRQQSVAAEPQPAAAQSTPRDGGKLASVPPVNTPPPTGVQSQLPRLVNTDTTDTIERLKARILGDLERGPRACSQRALAGELGVSVGYVNKVLKELARGGHVSVHASPAGTRLELATA